MRRMLILTVIAVAFLATVASGGNSSSKGGSNNGTSGGAVSNSDNGANPPQADVAITGCALADNQFEGPVAHMTVTNHSSKTSDYSITVAFDSPDGKTQLDTAGAFVQNLAAGQASNQDATSTKQELRGQQFTCKVAQVERTAATGG